MTPDEQAILTPERVATVNAILHPNGPGATLGDPPPSLKAEMTQAREQPSHFPPLDSSLRTRTRKRRSDAGVKKGPKVIDGPVIITLTVEQARAAALAIGASDPKLGTQIQDEVIAQLRRRIDALERQKEANCG